MADKILFVLDEICSNTNIKPCKKVVQKLFYLMQRKKLNLGIDFSMHYYGPYSPELSQKLHYYELYDYIKINTSDSKHTISVIKTSEKSFTEREKEIVDKIIDLYAERSSSDLELLSTTDYVANYLLDSDNLSKASIVNGVKRIKGKKFSDKKINASIEDLVSESFVLLKN